MTLFETTPDDVGDYRTVVLEKIAWVWWKPDDEEAEVYFGDGTVSPDGELDGVMVKGGDVARLRQALNQLAQQNGRNRP